MKFLCLLLPSHHSHRPLIFGGLRRYLSSKKDISQPLATTYNAKEVESGWYEWWEEKGFFRQSDAKENFVMILPPPNVTGHLHLGHALTCAIQDALARWHQMNGKKVVWVPGCDHAGIATQVVVERHLWASKQTTRHQLGREQFINEIMKWKEEKGTTIYDQMKRLGVSLDWDRAIYTMDDDMCKSVSHAFVQLFDCGLVYRKVSLINWCCELQSAISNIEVEHLELEGPTPLRVPSYEKPIIFGQIYDFAYRLSDSDEEIVVSTTRPETMLGDTAVMVNPDDHRYAHLVGRKLFHPFRKDDIPVIADTQVDPGFGTGAVKVTPAHSNEDYEVGMRHKLPHITIFDEQGKLKMSEFIGQPRFTARESVLDALKQLGLYRSCKPHPMVIPRCSRTNDIIEPLLKPQWYINVREMASKAVLAVQNRDLEIYPSNYKSVWDNWLVKNIQDWCISRQLWWGHRIPAYCIQVDDDVSQEEVWIAALSEEEAKAKFLRKSGIPESRMKDIRQDEDVLDTWFSSGLLPFAAFGWPQSTEDLNCMYPTTLLETGHDILFFWVARMVMLGLQLTGKLPFQTVLLHGLIHDAQGEKMSKSKGNIIDPMDVINGAPLEVLQSRISESEKHGLLTSEEAAAARAHQASTFPKGIPECGADALRFSLCYSSIENQIVTVDINRMEQHKFFCNKIWQVMRFLTLALSGTDDDRCCAPLQFSQRNDLQVMDRWILSHLSSLVSSAQKNFSSFNQHLVAIDFEHFWYKCLCDVYLESIKPVLKSSNSPSRDAALQTLWTCVDQCIRILSPFMPYLTEELYQRLPSQKEKKDSIMECSYPLPYEWDCWRDETLENNVQVLLKAASQMRHLKGNYQLKGSKNIQGSMFIEDKQLAAFFRESASAMQTLSRINTLSILEPPAVPPSAAAVAVVSEVTNVYLHLEGLIDPTLECQRLNQKLEKLKKSESKILKKMSHSRFKSSPSHIQTSTEAKLTSIQSEMDQVLSLLKSIKKLI